SRQPANRHKRVFQRAGRKRNRYTLFTLAGQRFVVETSGQNDVTSQTSMIPAFGLAFLAAAVISFGLLLCLRPLLSHYALAKPNVRSSHKVPTPQGGGIAVIAATAIVVAATEIFLPHHANDLWRLAVIFASAIGLALVGATD